MKFTHWFKITLLGTSAIFLACLMVIVTSLAPVSRESMLETISVPRGMSIQEIAILLHDAELIRSSVMFKLYSFFSGAAHRLKPGHYVFASGLSTPQIVEKLVSGPEDVSVTIIEGRSLLDIDDQLTALGFIHAGELAHFPVQAFVDKYPFLKARESLEGFLFPDTYRFAPHSTPSQIVEKMLENFTQKVFLPYTIDTDFKNESLYKTLIIASLIEREVPFSRDRFLVSGIFHRRLALGMALQIDATVLYGVCEGRTLVCSSLTKENFQINSEYNTYLKNGLPPTPIANPGTSALDAAKNPEKSDFLYYLSDPETQKTIFARDLEEHNENRARYLHL